MKRLVLRVLSVLAGADIDTKAATRAVFRRNLDGEHLACERFSFGIDGLECRRCAFEVGRIVSLDPNRSVRANEATHSTLDTNIWIPNRNIYRDVALFVLSRSGGPLTVIGHLGNLDAIAFEADNLRRDVLDEIGRVIGNRRRHLDVACYVIRIIDLVDIIERNIDCGVVCLDYLFALAPICFLDRFLDKTNRLVHRDNLRQLEESRLHYGVDSGTEVKFLRQLDTVNNEEFCFFIDNLPLHYFRQAIPCVLRVVWGIEQEAAALFEWLQQIVFLDECPIVASDEIRLIAYICAFDRIIGEANMARRARAGLLRVIDEIALRVFIGGLTYDLDRVLIRADRAVGAEAPEHRLKTAVTAFAVILVPFEAGVRNVVVNAYGEMVFRLGFRQIVEDRLYHLRVELLRG